MTDARTVAVYDARARDYARLTASSRPDRHLRAFIRAVPAGGRVLDLGCGPANASAHMRAAGLLPDPVDASGEMVNLANATYGIGARQATFDDIAGEACLDGIWANFSLLHADRSSLPRHLLTLHLALRPGGVLHIGMKLGQGEARDSIDRLYTFVTRAELHLLLTEAGFRVTSTAEGTERGLAGTDDPWIVCRAVRSADA